MNAAYYIEIGKTLGQLGAALDEHERTSQSWQAKAIRAGYRTGQVLKEMAAKQKLRVFVFGSNLAGRHGKGAAKHARTHYGAEYGVGVGRTGNAYAIPTKDENLQPLPLEVIRRHVVDFIAYAKANPQVPFFVTRVGCGLAGYKDKQIAPMFRGAPDNCELPVEWRLTYG